MQTGAILLTFDKAAGPFPGDEYVMWRARIAEVGVTGTPGNKTKAPLCPLLLMENRLFTTVVR